MKHLTILLFIFFGLNGIAQVNNIERWSLTELKSIGEAYGLDSIEAIVDPFYLVFFDYSIGNTLVDLELSSNLYSENNDSTGIIYHSVPDLTVLIATRFDSHYAAEKLFEYYSSIPKKLRSDTLQGIYSSLRQILPIFISYNLPNLIDRLKLDFYAWERIAQNTPPKKYPTFEDIKSQGFLENSRFNESRLIVDANLVAFNLAYGLYYMNEQNFNIERIEQLWEKQTSPFLRKPPFYLISKSDKFTKGDIVTEVDLERSYANILSLINDGYKFETYLLKGVENCCGVKLIQIIYNTKNIAVVEYSYNNGYNTYKITLNGKSLKIELIGGIDI